MEILFDIIKNWIFINVVMIYTVKKIIQKPFRIEIELGS